MGVMILKQIEIKKTNDILYYDILDNGLQIFMIPKQNLNTTFVSFNVKYGAINNEFIPKGEKTMKTFPGGIAHFLEHKMFEQENGIDPMKFYAENGADVNAYTSLYNTAYHFSCSSHLKENIEYLLDFVQEPYFTDENVNKEKGIIEEEIRMYNDDPYSYLDEKIRLNAFKDHPIKYSIAGTIEDINAITKEDLYTCYNTFYHPSNMFLVISGKFDVNQIMDIIKENQNKKNFDKTSDIILKDIKEEDSVVHAHEEKQMNVEVPKMSYGIKIPIKHINMEYKKCSMYLSIMMDCLFGWTSTFNEEMREKGYLLSYISISPIETDSHILMTLSADTEYVNELIKAIKERLHNIDVGSEDFFNKVKMIASSNIYLFEDAESINRHVTHDLIMYGKYYANIDSILNELSKEEFDNLVKKLDFSNITTLVIKAMGKK